MKDISRGTKCFGANSSKHVRANKNGKRELGAFPNGFLNWVKKMGWWGQKRCYLCAGWVLDDEAVRVDIRPELKPTHCEDARKTSLPDNEFDCVIIDPPYSRLLAKDLYDTEEYYSSINQFAKEAARICKPGGLIITLTYEIPKRIKGCDFISVWGIYQIPSVSHMRCFTVSKKITGDKS